MKNADLYKLCDEIQQASYELGICERNNNYMVAEKLCKKIAGYARRLETEADYSLTHVREG